MIIDQCLHKYQYYDVRIHGGRRPTGNGGVGGRSPPNVGMAAIPNSEVIRITPELLFPHLGAGYNSGNEWGRHGSEWTHTLGKRRHELQ